ncbi:hypothetical protein [Neisseria elongata]|nr:hypothetical protein [Neisseria elongata]
MKARTALTALNQKRPSEKHSAARVLFQTASFPFRTRLKARPPKR